MAEDISFNMSEPFTPNATIDPTPQEVTISFLSTTNLDSKTAQEIYASPDSCIFYTPECSSHNSEIFIVPPSPLTNGDPVCSNIEPNYQQEKQYTDPLFSTNTTEFICNLNPPNSSFKIGASPTQIGKVTLLSIPHTPTTRANKIACVPISPMIPAKYRRNMVRNIPTRHLQETAKEPDSPLGYNTNPASNSNDMVLCKSPPLNKREFKPRISVLPNHKSPKSSFKQKQFTQPRKAYNCQHCSNTYTLSNKYESHLFLHSNNIELFRCDICNKTFPTKRGYTVHTYSHVDNNATRKSARKSMISEMTVNYFPQTLSSITNNTKESIAQTTRLSPADRATIHDISQIDKTMTSVQSSTSDVNISKNKKVLSPPLNSPITSTPFSTKPNKHKPKRIQQSEVLLDPSSPDLPEIGFSNKQAFSLPSTTNLVEPIYPCNQCTKSYLSQRALNIHLCAHRKAGQVHDTTKNPKRTLRNVFKKNSPCKLCDFDCSLQVNC